MASPFVGTGKDQMKGRGRESVIGTGFYGQTARQQKYKRKLESQDDDGVACCCRRWRVVVVAQDFFAPTCFACGAGMQNVRNLASALRHDWILLCALRPVVDERQDGSKAGRRLESVRDLMTLSWWRARIYSADARGVTFCVSQVPEGESGDRGWHGCGRGLITFFLGRRVNAGLLPDNTPAPVVYVLALEQCPLLSILTSGGSTQARPAFIL